MMRLLLLCLLALGTSAYARAEDTTQSDLYQEALQSIAEGRNHDAYETLKRLIEREPTHAGAWMEVALIQCSLGRSEEAERLFAEIEQRFKPSAGIIELIKKSRATGCTNWNVHRQANLSLARGFDQNINQGAASPTLAVTGGMITLTSDFLPKADQYTLLGADYVRDISTNGSNGFAQFQLRKNDHYNQYNSASAYAGIETPWRWQQWTLRSSAMLGLVTLGGELYQRQLQLQARVGPPLPLPGSVQMQVLAGMTHVDYLTLTHFNANTYELRGILNYRAPTSHLSASFGLLNDQGHALRPGGNRHGSQTSLVLRQGLAYGAWTDLSYTRQTWQSASFYSPGLIDTTRSQRTQALRAALVYPLASDQTLTLEVRKLVNHENISIFQYNNRQVQLSWQWQQR